MSRILTNERGNISLELKEDNLSAWLCINDQDQLNDEKDVLDLIVQAGIKNGFDEAARYMRKTGLEKDFGIPFPVAMCNYVKGETKLNYYFNLEQAKQFSEVVSAAELKRLTCLDKGSVVADYSNNLFDRQGSIYDIFGEMIQDEEFGPESIDKITGDNLIFDLQKNQLIAECAGYPQVDEDGRINLVAGVVIDSAVRDLTDGLRSPVDLEIRGDVQRTCITSAGAIRVRGGIQEAEIWCEGTLEVDGHIENCRHQGLKVLGDIRCAGIVNSQVLCKGKIEFRQNIQGSDIVADGGIEAPGGSLGNSRVECGYDILLARLGDPTGKPTEVEINLSPFTKALLMQLTKELIHLKQEPVGREGEIDALNERIRQCETELDGELNSYLRESAGHKIRILAEQVVFPPVKIRLLKDEYSIIKPQKYLELIEKD